MIAALRGKVLSKGINNVIVDVQGVGYDVAVSLASLEAIPQDGDVFLHVHTSMRENALELYGFVTQDEKALFEMLLKVAGIGPKTSLIVLSGISPDGFRRAVLESDLHKLTSIPGIGKKSAERIVLELKEKISKMPAGGACTPGKQTGESLEQDIVSSLLNLGYKERVAETVAHKVAKEAAPGTPLSTAIKSALKELMK
jgi:Holliday junction DNA helicase RuvA